MNLKIAIQSFSHLVKIRISYSSISRSGIITKSRSCIKGCGKVSVGVVICKSSYISMSMSIGRSWYSPSTDFALRPSFRSIFWVIVRICSGDNTLFMRTHIFTDSNPHGSVSSGDDSRSILPTSSFIMAMARRIMAWRSPRLEPSER